MKKSQIELKCAECGQKFIKVRGEYNRSERLGRKHYCGRSCAAKNWHEHLTKWTSETNPRGCGIQLDELSPFRYYLRNAKNRARDKNRELNITLEYLKDLWETQKGICPYTGWNMETVNHYGDIPQLNPRRASIDRIDSSKGYIKGNVQFVCFMANMAKNRFSSKELIEFCKAVTNNF